MNVRGCLEADRSVGSPRLNTPQHAHTGTHRHMQNDNIQHLYTHTTHQYTQAHRRTHAYTMKPGPILCLEPNSVVHGRQIRHLKEAQRFVSMNKYQCVGHLGCVIGKITAVIVHFTQAGKLMKVGSLFWRLALGASHRAGIRGVISLISSNK